MSDAYIFVSEGSQEAHIDVEGQSYDASYYARYALLKVKSIEVALEEAKYLNRYHGASLDEGDYWVEFEAISETELSDDDFQEILNLKLRKNKSAKEKKYLRLAKEVLEPIQKRIENSVKAILESLNISSEQIEARTESNSVILWGETNRPIVNRKQKSVLTACDYRLVKKLINARGKGLKMQDIKKNHTNPTRALNKLRQDQDWKKVIQMSGTSRRGYRIT